MHFCVSTYIYESDLIGYWGWHKIWRHKSDDTHTKDNLGGSRSILKLKYELTRKQLTYLIHDEWSCLHLHIIYCVYFHRSICPVYYQINVRRLHFSIHKKWLMNSWWNFRCQIKYLVFSTAMSAFLKDVFSIEIYRLNSITILQLRNNNHLELSTSC